MYIEKTSQLMKTLALDFIHNKTFNTAIMNMLCQDQRVHASTTTQQLVGKIRVIDKGFCLLRDQIRTKRDKRSHRKHNTTQSQSEKALHNMFSVFLFNVSSINEHYINQVSRQLAESTASQSFTDMNTTIYKDKMAISMLKEHLVSYFWQFTERSGYLREMVEEESVDEWGLALLETVDYLCVKYSVKSQMAGRIVEVLEMNETKEENSSQINVSVVKHINQLLFGQSQDALFHLLETNSHIDIKNILTVISANYLTTRSQRKIFSSSEKNGKQVMESIIVKIIKRVGKNELFNEKNEEYTPFRFVLLHFLHIHFAVYWQFNLLVRQFMAGGETLTSENKLNALRKVEKFFRIFVAIENPHFQHIIKFTNDILASKYSEPVALQLMKKLLLNRFLLNPTFFVIYNDPSQEEVKKYVQTANVIRTLFYPNKSSDLASKTNCAEIIQISSEILNSLQYCLKKEKDSKLLAENASPLYVNDKILKTMMQKLNQEVKLTEKSPRQGVQLQNMVSDYSLSFSIVKNENLTRNNLSQPTFENVSEVKLAPNTNRTNMKDNQSIRYMYDQLKGQKSQSEIPPKSPQKRPMTTVNAEIKQEKQKQQVNQSDLGRVSELARKEHEVTNQTRLNTFTLPTDRQIIEELVEFRKEYGEMKKSLKRQYESRRLRNTQRMALLSSFTVKFNQFKAEIEKDNDSLYVHMTTIA